MRLQDFRSVCCALVAGTLLLATTRAEVPAAQQNKSQDQSQQTSQDKMHNKSPANATQQWIDQLSSKVDLTKDQKNKIREKLSANGEQVSSTWNKFAEANAKAIALEATMYAAIEDGMSDQQKQQFRENRKNRKNKKGSSTQGSDKQWQGKRGQDEQVQDAQTATKTVGTDPGQKASQGQTAADATSNQPAATTDGSSKSSPAKKADKSSGQQASSDNPSDQNDQAYPYVTEMIIVPVQESASGVQMDEQQRQQCDKACQQFHSKLRQAYTDVQRYHDQLVQLEAEKLRAVEEVLNDSQLKKLKEDRSEGQSS